MLILDTTVFGTLGLRDFLPPAPTFYHTDEAQCIIFQVQLLNINSIIKNVRPDIIFRTLIISISISISISKNDRNKNIRSKQGRRRTVVKNLNE